MTLLHPPIEDHAACCADPLAYAKAHGVDAAAIGAPDPNGIDLHNLVGELVARIVFVE